MKWINSKKRIILIIFLAVIIVAVAGFAYYVSDYYHADNTAISALQSTEAYSVENTADFITLTPTGNKSTTGIIFYPGGKVQAEAYVPLASKLAENNYTTIIVKMPFNLAVFGANKADSVIANHPEIKKWIMGGHSLGGVFASDYAVNHQDKIRGVIYLAAYPSANASKASFKALSIRGSLDGVAKEQNVLDNKNKFPANTTFITINGGNHFNFGNYGIQSGDNNSTITREEQQNQTVQHIIEFINSI